MKITKKYLEKLIKEQVGGRAKQAFKQLERPVKPVRDPATDKGEFGGTLDDLMEIEDSISNLVDEGLQWVEEAGVRGRSAEELHRIFGAIRNHVTFIDDLWDFRHDREQH